MAVCNCIKPLPEAQEYEKWEADSCYMKSVSHFLVLCFALSERVVFIGKCRLRVPFVMSKSPLAFLL